MFSVINLLIKVFKKLVRFQVLKADSIMMTVCCDIARYSLAELMMEAVRTSETSAQLNDITRLYIPESRSQWPRGLRHRSAAAWLLGSRVRIPLRAGMFVSCVYMLCCPVQVEVSATG
jgi:hypothetical protein